MLHRARTVPASGLRFEDGGIRSLRGLPEEVRLYRVLAANEQRVLLSDGQWYDRQAIQTA